MSSSLFRSDPNTWLEKQATVRLARVKLIEAAYYNQGVLFKCADQYNQSKYLLLLHDRQRTANFLSFMKRTFCDTQSVDLLAKNYRLSSFVLF